MLLRQHEDHTRRGKSGNKKECDLLNRLKVYTGFRFRQLTGLRI